MSARYLIVAAALVLGVLATTALLSAQGTDGSAPTHGHVIVKICHWDGVVPDKALDGFDLPGGKWADFQKKGWRLEQYVVAPVSPKGAMGLYAVLRK